jgi:hypothetical protein
VGTTMGAVSHVPVRAQNQRGNADVVIVAVTAAVASQPAPPTTLPPPVPSCCMTHTQRAHLCSLCVFCARARTVSCQLAPLSPTSPPTPTCPACRLYGAPVPLPARDLHNEHHVCSLHRFRARAGTVSCLPACQRCVLQPPHLPSPRRPHALACTRPT